MYLAVNPDGAFLLFREVPKRKREKVLIEDKESFTLDHYGNVRYGQKDSGQSYECWYDFIYSDFGFKIKKSSLNSVLCDMTWKDEPIMI